MGNAILVLLLFLPGISLVSQAAPGQKPCKQKTPSQREMNDCAALEHRQAEARLNNIYRKAIEYMTDDQARRKDRATSLRSTMSKHPSRT
jgi:uncharacterized protein YecT (DUF1311 family)